MFRKKWLATLLSLMMVFAFMPISTFVYAAEDNATTGTEPTLYEVTNPDAVHIGGLYTSKTLNLDKNGEGTITLEAYSEGKVETTTQTKPVDIVLVLDMSGSMNYCVHCGASGTHHEQCEICGQPKTSANHDVSICTICGKTETEGDHANVDICKTCGKTESAGDHDTFHCTVCGKVKNSEEHTICTICGKAENDRVHNRYSIKYKHDFKPAHNYQPGHRFEVSGHTFTPGHEYVPSGHESVSRISETKKAAKAFIESVKLQAASDGQTHRVAIVKFAGENRNSVGNDFYSSGTNYSQIVCEPTNVDGDGAAALETAVDSLKAGGATRADYGMKHAESIINGITRDSNKFVIMLTDGTPTTSTAWDNAVANSAISSAKNIKDKGAKVYTIGMFDTKPSSDSNVGKYMNYVSSNYPSASSMTASGTKASESFYLNVGNNINLSDIFQIISNEIAESVTELTEDSVVSDVISGGFEINGNINGDISGAVKVSKIKYTGKNDAALSWGQPEDITESVTVSIEGSKVNVTGFDFANNFVVDTSDGPQGYKLVIKIPVKIDLDKITLDGSTIYSNGAGSGIREKSTDENTARDFGSPAIKVATIISYEASGGGSVSRESEIIGTNMNAGDIKGSTATAGEGYTFINWTDSEGNVVSKDAEFKPSEVAYETYTAHFAKLNVKNYEKVYDGEWLSAETPTFTGADADKYDIQYWIDTSQWTSDEENIQVNTPRVKRVTDGAVTVTAKAVPKEAYANSYNVLSAKFTMKVTPRPVTITVKDDTKKKGADDPEFAAPEIEAYNKEGGTGLVAGDSLGTITVVRTDKDQNGGEAVGVHEDVLDATVADKNSNYDIKVVKGDFTITKGDPVGSLSAKDAEKIYNKTALHAEKPQVSGVGSDSDYEIYFATEKKDGEWINWKKWTEDSQPSITDAGNVVVGIKAVDANGNYGDMEASLTMTVKKRTVKISVDNKEITYGDPDPQITGSVQSADGDAGLISGDSLDQEYKLISSISSMPKAAGTYEDIFTATHNNNANYEISLDNGTLKINKKPATGISISASGGSKVYDGTAISASASIAGAGEDGVYEIVASGDKSITDVGSSEVSFSAKIKDGVENPESYDLPDPVKVTIKVTPRPIQLKSQGGSKEYDGKPLTKPEVEAVGEYNFVSGEASATATGSVTTVKQSGADGLTNTIAISKNSSFKDKNYDIQPFDEGKLIITPAQLTVKPNNKTKMAGAANPKLDGTISGYKNGENNSVINTMPSYRVIGKANSAGKYTIVAGGAQADNYVFVYGTATLTVKANTTPPGNNPPGGNGGGGAVVPGGGPGTVVQVTPAPAPADPIQVEEKEPPKESLELGSWALFNLLLSILACLMSISLIITYFTRKKEEDEEEDASYQEDQDENIKKKGLWRVISIVWGIFMLIVFFLTEDMSLPMALIDKWTILMAVMAAIQGGIMILSKKKYEDEEEDSMTA